MARQHLVSPAHTGDTTGWPVSSGSRLIVACGVFLAATLGMFGDVLLAGNARILSKGGEDLSSILLYWHQFGFDELKKGNLALWNPHVFSGAPYLGAFQPALLYPPNWLHLVLPLAFAINVGIALHFFMAGVWTYLWTAHRRLHPAACIFAGIVFMFCGAHFLQLYRGHLPNLRTIVWMPLILLAVDGILETGSLRWLLPGSAAVAMQILAGHVQYVFYTGVSAGLYAAIVWIGSVRSPRTAVVLLALYPAGALLAAIQLLPGLDAISESLRSGLDYEIARTFAFPPENVLTLFMPGALGDMVSTPYWGRWTLSEMSLYIGAAGVFLVTCGIVNGERARKRCALTMALVSLILSFGYYTPLFGVLYDYVPGFGSFRGIAKFNVIATLFLVMLGAVGFDHLLTTRDLPRWPLRTALATAVVLILAGLALLASSSQGADGAWGRMLHAIDFNEEAFRYFPVKQPADFVEQSGKTAARSLLWGGGAFLVLGSLMYGARYARSAVYGIALLGCVELFSYAWHCRLTFDPAPAMQYATAVREFLAATPGDYRLLSGNPYATMTAGGHDIWGYDPMVLSRYARFVASTQGLDPDATIESGPIRKLSSLFAMLRLRYVFRPDLQPTRVVTSSIQELPRALLVSRWRVFADGHEMLAAMADPGFDPHDTVFLEADPDPVPIESEGTGSVSVVDLSTDALEIRADVPAPAVLLLTDNFSSGWQVTDMDGGSRQKYALVPANYTLRAIALDAGTHHLHLEYAPRAFTVGKWVTLVSLLAYAAACGVVLRRRASGPGPVI